MSYMGERNDIVTGQIRASWQRHPVGKSALEEWAEWTRVDRDTRPVFALTVIYDASNREEWDHDEEGLKQYAPDELAARRRSEPLQEARGDPVETGAFDERRCELIDVLLHRPQTPAVWRAVAFSFLTAGPEHEMPWLAGMYLRRVNPSRPRKPMQDEAFLLAMDSLLEFIELMLDEVA